MENTEIVAKSVLKKPETIDFNKVKKVTFCNTVKVFIDDKNKNIKSDSIEDRDLKWIEISIVDKSNDSLSAQTFDDSKVTDFLVHKVIYDNYILPDNDEDFDIQTEEDDSIVLESVLDEDGLEFVVHKVTDHEDDLVKQESDLDGSFEENENISSSDLEANEVITKFSKLSIENILEHDKIIAFIDQRSLGLSALNKSITIAGTADLCDTGCIKKDYSLNNSCDKTGENFVLSPPLQELSLDKIVKAHSDNILCELDISPLNSIQESDSDSDLSSEGTMIMMTSEECQKNEQHIRESFLQYQSKKEKLVKVNTELSISSSETLHVSEKSLDLPPDNTNYEYQSSVTPLCEDKINLATSDFTCIKTDSSDFNKNESSDPSVLVDLPTDSFMNQPCPFKKKHSSSLPDTDISFSNFSSINPKHVIAMRRSSFDSCTTFPSKPLTSVEIPSDVREWKILLSSFEKKTEMNLPNGDQTVQCKYKLNSNEKCNFESYSNCMPSSQNVSKSDELENFVNESTERVERIRKRYYVNAKHVKFGIPRHSPVRGVRPRFGSTAEILQLMQKQNLPPIITFSNSKHHMSWPCDETNSSCELKRNGKHFKHPFNISQSLSSECSSQSSIDSFCEVQSSSGSCDHCSISSCPSIIIHERGVPEGASPSKPLTEICNPSSEYYTSENSDSYVYYSMKV